MQWLQNEAFSAYVEQQLEHSALYKPLEYSRKVDKLLEVRGVDILAKHVVGLRHICSARSSNAVPLTRAPCGVHTGTVSH